MLAEEREPHSDTSSINISAEALASQLCGWLDSQFAARLDEALKLQQESLSATIKAMSPNTPRRLATPRGLDRFESALARLENMDQRSLPERAMPSNGSRKPSNGVPVAASASPRAAPNGIGPRTESTFIGSEGARLLEDDTGSRTPMSPLSPKPFNLPA